jgi:hypothetical protein
VAATAAADPTKPRKSLNEESVDVTEPVRKPQVFATILGSEPGL